MNSINKILRTQVGNISKNVVRQFLDKKLARDGIEIPKAAVDALADHIASGNDQDFTWVDDETGEEPEQIRHLKLNFDESDASEIETLTSRITASLPQIIQEAVDHSGVLFFKGLRKRWPNEGEIQRLETDEFCTRIEERWGEGLDLLRMLLTCCREFGHESLRRHQKSQAKSRLNRRFVLTNLHARSCQVADEIICLMANGFADGAMARWRTLHELSVVATLIADGDEALAERYINHDVVEVKRQADDYNLTQVPLGYPPISKRVQRRIDNDFVEVLKQYGPEFGSPYGWATIHLNKKRPTFKDLQDFSGRSGMNSYYKLASFNVHAGARTMFFRHSNLGRDDVVVAGRSNAGLSEPAQHTAYSLLQISALLLENTKNFDRLLEMQTFISIRNAIPSAFARADKKLRRDEAHYQRSLAKERRQA